jgi:hypothetical protein
MRPNFLLKEPVRTRRAVVSSLWQKTSPTFHPAHETQFQYTHDMSQPPPLSVKLNFQARLLLTERENLIFHRRAIKEEEGSPRPEIEAAPVLQAAEWRANSV